MTFIKQPLGDAKPPEVVPEDLYTLIIESVDKVEEPDGSAYVMLRLSIVGEPEAGAVFHRLGITLPEDPSKARWAMLFTKAFLKLFGVPYEADGWDDEEVQPGMQAEVFLEISEWEGRKSNRIKLDPNSV